jgi:hypothetical protein
MVFLSSLSPDITEDIPTPLSGGGGKALAATGDARFDVSVNGLPFNLKITPQFPYKRESEQVRKDQFDTSGEPGEQSLAAWWIRSESSFHLGAGIKYYDPGSDRSTTNRFATSQGVDVWKQGEVSLLHAMEVDQTGLTEPVHLSTFRSGGQDGWVSASGDKLYWRGGGAPGGTLERRNYSYNPRCLQTAPNARTGWLNSGTATGVDVTTVTTGGPFGFGYRMFRFDTSGTWSLSCGDRASGTNANPVHSEFGEGDDYIVSQYVMADWEGDETITANMSLIWSNSSGTTISTQAVTASLENNVWKRIVMRFNGRPALATHFRISTSFNSTSSVSDGNVRMTGLLVEKGTELLPYFDGSMADANGHDYQWFADLTNNARSRDFWTPGSEQTLAGTGLTQPAPVGGSVYVGRTNAVTKWDIIADVVTTPWTCTGQARCWWVKNRLIVAVGRNLYWVDHTQTGVIETAAAGNTTAKLLATGADDTWVWSDVSDTGDAILAAGAGETASAIFAITIEEEAAVPVFSGAREVARLPQGEQVTCMGTYLASYIVLGTTKGIRVGATGQSGQIELGPVMVELVDGPRDVSFFDRFAYLPVSRALPDGTSGVVRVDLSESIIGEAGTTGLFPWAWDVFPGGAESDATSICFNGNTGRVVLAVGQNVYLESTTLLESGHLDTGLIRYATSESKDFQRVRMTGDIRGGKVKVEALIAGVPSSVYTYGLTTGLEGEATLNLPGGPLFDELAFRFTITRTTAVSPIVNTLSVKSIPAVRKSRLITFPLQVADFESTRYGNSVGYDGFGINRVEELETLENAGAAVQIIDRRYDEAMVGTIETLDFAGMDSPDGEYDNDGGILTMVVRVR